MNIFNYLAQSALQFGSLGAVYCGDECRASFAQLEARAMALASALHDAAKPGDRIVIASKNCAQYPEIMFGIWAAGMVAVPVNAKLHEQEIADIIEDSAPAVILASADIAAALAPFMHDKPAQLIAIGTDAYDALLARPAADPVARQADDLAWLFYTSGTTGRSKGAMLTHGNLAAMTQAHFADIDQPDETSSLLHAAPMSHGSGLYMLPYIASGARQIIPESGGFDPDEFLRLCHAHPAVRAFLAPTMVQRLRLQAQGSGQDAGNLELIIYGGGPMYVDDLRKSLEHFGPKFAQIYGQGEAPMTITALSRQAHENASGDILGSVGQARSGIEIVILDADGKQAPCDQTGEILCRGDVVMSGYWNNAEATQAALEGGWLRTGDMGSLDAAGFLTLRDRSKDVIISGGSNIYPREVEEVLLQHPLVAEVAVVGEADPEWGEVVVAHIASVGGKAIDTAELDQHCLNHIARFKRPKRYMFHNQLPKNAYGKILKRELRSAPSQTA